MRTKPVIRRLSVDDVRAEAARFETAHPGVGADDYPDVFRDANGELIETEEFFEVSGLYSLLATHGE